MDEEEMVEDTFSSPDDLSDVVLIVEEKKIFAHKSILAKISPVFSRMFGSNGFRESQTNEAHLPGKQHSQIVELLKCVYPNILKPIDGSNAFYLLPLADEYSILILKRHIERYFLSTLVSISCKYGDTLTRLFDLLQLSQIYRLTRLEQELYEQLTNHFEPDQWKKLSLSLEIQCHLLEMFARKQQTKLKDKQARVKQLEDLCTRQKFDIQRLQSQLESTTTTTQ